MRRLAKGIWKRRWARWAAIVAVAMVVLNVALVEATSQSWFCNSCHLMKPFYANWKSSEHADVKCVKCHIEPGMDGFFHAKLNGLGQVVDDLLNRTSNKPSASVSQMACLRSGCHSMESVMDSDPDNGKFRFSHGEHVDKSHYGIAVTCTTCHSHVKGDVHFEVNTDACITCHLLEREPDAIAAAMAEQRVDSPRVQIRLAVREGHDPYDPRADEKGRPPATCEACHKPPAEPFEHRGLLVDHAEYISYGASCESCHRGNTATPAPIDDGACLSCHIHGVEEALPVEDMHRVHNEGKHKIECFSCHGTMQHGPTAQTLSLQHFDCRSCHTDQHIVQRRTYLHDVGDPHSPADGRAVSPMFMAHVDCTGCHVEPTPLKAYPDSAARVARPTPEACDTCHQPGLGAQMIPLWQNAARGLYERALAELEALDAELLDDRALGRLAEARSLLDTVRMDGSWGVHNPRYTQQLLERARDAIAAAGAQQLPEQGP